MPVTSTYGFRYRALSDTPDIAAGTQNLAEDVEAKFVTVDAAVAAAAPTASSATNNTGFNTASGAFTTTGGTVVSVVFTAKTASVMLHWSASLRQQNAGNNVYVSPEVRTGGVVGSGTVVLSADQENCLRVSAQTTTRFGASYHLSGLTPGAQYNVRLLHSVAPGGTGEVGSRHLAVVML